MCRVKVFQIKVKGHMLKIHGTIGKILSKGTRLSNLKGLSLKVKKYKQKLNFYKCRSKVTVKVTCSTLMVPSERYCHKEHTCQI